MSTEFTAATAKRGNSVTNAEQFQRTLTVLTWFRNHPEGTFMEAAADLGMKASQIKHELHQVSLCGLPGHYPGSLVEVSMDRLRATVEYTAGLDHPVRLSPMEAGVVLLSLEAIRSTLPPDRQPAVASASAKIQRLLPHGGSPVEPTQESSGDEPGGGVGDGGEAEPELPETVVRLREAIDQRCSVTMLYHSVSSDSLRRRHVHPDYLGLINGETYLWAREVGTGGTTPPAEHKCFAVSRITEIDLGEAGSAGPLQRPTIDRDDPFKFGDSEQWALVRVRADHAWMLEYYPMWLVEDDAADEDLSTVSNEEGRSGQTGDFDVYLPNTGQWTRRLLTAFSHGLQVIEPLTLAEEVRQQAEDGLNAYAEHLGVKPS